MTMQCPNIAITVHDAGYSCKEAGGEWHENKAWCAAKVKRGIGCLHAVMENKSAFYHTQDVGGFIFFLSTRPLAGDRKKSCAENTLY